MLDYVMKRRTRSFIHLTALALCLDRPYASTLDRRCPLN